VVGWNVQGGKVLEIGKGDWVWKREVGRLDVIVSGKVWKRRTAVLYSRTGVQHRDTVHVVLSSDFM
jgi:hypothetical protein